MVCFTAAFLAIHCGSSVGDHVTYDWRVTNLTASYDGVSIRSIGINGKTSDQSVLDVELGQEVEVRATIELDEPTCLHLHGLKQLGTQEMDGTSELTQCHIDPNGAALYRFTPDKAGTFRWHSHYIAQYAYGLRGPLVAHAPPSEQQDWEKDIDEEFIIQMADLYHRPPQPVRMWDNILINNRGRYHCTAAIHHNFTECTDDQPLSQFHFKAGSKYLLRLINMAALSPIQFSIDDHEFQGSPNTGKQGGKQDQFGSFWMRATGLLIHGLPWSRGTPAVAGEGYNYEGLAIVAYETGGAEEPTSEQQVNMTTVNEFDFTPLVPVVLPSAPSDHTVLQLKMQDGLGYFSIDEGDFNHFTLPDNPPLYSIAAGLKTEDLLPAVHSDGNGWCLDAGYVTLRFNADNPGVWIMHCHIDWHLLAGLAMVFVEGEEQLQQKGGNAFSSGMLLISVCGYKHVTNSTSNSTMT
ncbi:unnamed protein product [Phytophthora fragariaefolia]|uniref:Unnamed protein product n=1 Tax=Phytophthora fragariaefolia TaxID=1490495 RepID=A0A9W6Y1C7_9STRA|nr:unnamed protein product [Phytophthora fragariaefolia]